MTSLLHLSLGAADMELPGLEGLEYLSPTGSEGLTTPTGDQGLQGPGAQLTPEEKIAAEDDAVLQKILASEEEEEAVEKGDTMPVDAASEQVLEVEDLWTAMAEPS